MIQKQLLKQGLYQGRVDGLFGSELRAAIEEYLSYNKNLDLNTQQGAGLAIGELVALPPLTNPIVIKALDLAKQANAKRYIEDVREFISLNPNEFDPLFIAGSFIPALKEVQHRDFNIAKKKSISSFLKLVAYTRGSAPFRVYHGEQRIKRYEAEESKRASTTKAIAAHIGSLRARIVSNPLSPRALKLYQIIKKYQTIPKGANLNLLQKKRDSLEKELKKLGVLVAVLPASKSRTSVTSIVYSLAELKALSDVDEKDITIFVNLGRDAPHAFLNLSGKIVFEDKVVKACAPSITSLSPRYQNFLEAAIKKELPNHRIQKTKQCRDGMKGWDAFIVTGTDLAKSQDLPPTYQFVAGLNNKTFRRLMTVKHSDFNRELKRRDLLSLKYENEIRQGVRNGFGALAVYEVPINKRPPDHITETTKHCRDVIKRLEALMKTGSELAKSQDSHPAHQFVVALKIAKELKVLEQMKEACTPSLKSVDLRNRAFQADAKVGCTVIKSDLAAHDQSIAAAQSALWFLNGVEIKEITNVSAEVAFRRAQKGQCALIYASEKTLKSIFDASANANIDLSPVVLPFWTTASTIADRIKVLQTKQAHNEQTQAEKKRQVELARWKAEEAEKNRQVEENAKRRAEAERLEAEAARLEQLQKRYRSQYGAKVASLVSSIDSQLQEVRDKIDGGTSTRNVDSYGFWGDFPGWYKDKRLKGWEFDSIVSTPKDYGIAQWRGRKVEMITAQIRVLMKNREIGDYSNNCWHVGYILDKDFSMNREHFVATCNNVAELTKWQRRNAFETRWELNAR